jgi:hypothetical protein
MIYNVEGNVPMIQFSISESVVSRYCNNAPILRQKASAQLRMLFYQEAEAESIL